MIQMKNRDVKSAYRLLREYQTQLTRQQQKTLVGQIKAGHPNEAMNGLAKILDRNTERSVAQNG